MVFHSRDGRHSQPGQSTPGPGLLLGCGGASSGPCVLEYSISAAAIAIFSLGFQIMGTILVLLSFRKKRDYLQRHRTWTQAAAGRRGAPTCAPVCAGRGGCPGEAPTRSHAGLGI